MSNENTGQKKRQGITGCKPEMQDIKEQKCPACGNRMCIMTVTAGQGWYCTRCGGDKIYFEKPKSKPCVLCGRDSVISKGKTSLCEKCGQMRVCETCYDKTCCFSVFSTSRKPNMSCSALSMG